MKEGILKKISRFYSRMKIQNKILLSLYMVILAVSVASVALIYYYNYRTAAEENQIFYQRIVESIRENVEYLQQDVSDISDFLSGDAQIHSILATAPEVYQEKPLSWFYDVPVAFIQNLLAVKSQFRTLIIYPENELSPYYVSRDTSIYQMDLRKIRETEFYQKAEEAKGVLVWFRMEEGSNALYEKNDSDKIVGVKMIFNMSKSRKLGLLSMGIDTSKFAQICENGRFSQDECVVITDGQGEVLLSVGELPDSVLRSAKKAENWEEPVKAGNYYSFRSISGDGGTYIYYFTPQKMWRQKARQMLLMPLLMLVCLWPLSSHLSRLLARPLNRLCDSMDKFRGGDFGQKVAVTSEDEIGQLTRSFNKMAEDIQNLIDQNYVMALREKKSELDILQAQINPHFLYNVLDSLYWRAVDMDNEEMGEEILALSNLFRLVLNQGQDIITVEKEVELVGCYLKIQKMRLETRLDYDIQVDEEILGCKISKLLIQPFVENAVVHGLEDSERGGYVKVRGFRQGDRLLFVIEDNGIGMEQNQADRILEEADKGRIGDHISHYAISNIKERLRLRYQDQYSLEIISKENQGTYVRLSIPFEEEKV